MENIIEKLSNFVPVPENEYLKNGLLHCSVCHKPTQKKIDFFGKEKVVRIICDCGKKEIEERKRREQAEELERRKSICFSETSMKNWNFENDDGKNEKISRQLKKYADHFQEFKKDGKGVILFGNVGTGKTYYACCVANAVLEAGYDVLLTNFVRLTNQIQGKFGETQEYIDSLNRYSLIVIDDLGVERKTEYVNEIMFNIIDSRYRAGLPVIITTNLSADEISHPGNMEYERLFDRIRERCFPIAVNGESRRRDGMRKNFEEMKRIMEGKND